MSADHVDGDVVDRESPSNGLELVQYGESKVARPSRSFAEMVDIPNTSPENMVSIGKFANIICGRIFLLQSSKLTDELLKGGDGLGARQFGGIESISTYHTLVMASVLKKRMDSHYFYSKRCTDVLESHTKRRRHSNEPSLLYKRQIKKRAEGICDAAIPLEKTIATEKKLYREVLMRDLQYPNFMSSCLGEIEDCKSILKEQVVNQDLKQRIEKERVEIKFLGELCSRLLVVTPLKKPKLVEAFLTTKDILNHVNRVVVLEK